MGLLVPERYISIASIDSQSLAYEVQMWDLYFELKNV